MGVSWDTVPILWLLHTDFMLWLEVCECMLFLAVSVTTNETFWQTVP